MRDRLIELLTNLANREGAMIEGLELWADSIADYLLSEGVIVPTDKPLPLIDEGDRVLCPICKTDLMGCYFGYEESPTVITCYGCGAWIDSTKAVDRDEAEKALEERS